MKSGRKFSVKSRIIAIVMLCWFIPLILILGINGYYIYSSHFGNKISKQMEQLNFNDQISVERLNKAIQLSRKASYDKELERIYQGYTKKEITKVKLIQSSSYYLSDGYRHENTIQSVILWYHDSAETLNCSTYNESVGGGYNQVSTYWKEDHSAIKEYAETLDTAVGFYSENNRLYVIRNLLNSSYEKIATLVILLNPEYCFENYSAFSENTSVTMHINQCILNLQGEKVTVKETGMNEIGGSAGYKWNGGKLHLFHKMNAGDYNLLTLVRFDDSSSFQLFYGYRLLMIGMLICLVPTLLILLRIFQRHITEPMENMMYGAGEIQKGNLGYQLETEPQSREFQYLANSFNEMSSRLKYQFDHIYEEELALRDAKIMALQSHINPHFMNNTLEIINWEARLSGNQKVSQMIEALSTLMDATIDRKKQPEVLLSEEMIYVNAYLYIIAERLGKRLTIHKELPEEIMQYKVPRLILQPVIENAIEHGVVKKGQGTVTLQARLEGSFLYLEIINEAVLSKAEMDKVERLLAFDYDTSKEPSGNMGIANVNQRLRIIYGEPCGLTIQRKDETHVLTRLTIRTT